MEYPEEFSAPARARVEAERITAHRDLEAKRNQVPWSRYGPVAADEKNLRQYILRVFLVFSEEACKLAGLWSVDGVRSRALEFLRRFTIEAYSEDGHDKSERKLREMISHRDGSLLPEAGREFRKCAEWGQFEKQLLALARVDARDGVEKLSRRPPATREKDPRKERIAIFKGRQRGIKARDVCVMLDQFLSREAPALKAKLEPLPAWVRKANGARTWVGVFDCKETHDLVRAYVNKVPALQTGKRGSI